MHSLPEIKNKLQLVKNKKTKKEKGKRLNFNPWLFEKRGEFAARAILINLTVDFVNIEKHQHNARVYPL